MTNVIHKASVTLLILANIALTTSFAFQFTNLIQGSFQAQKYKERIIFLSSNNEELNTLAKGRGDYEKIENFAEKMDFEKVQEIAYINTLNQEVAKTE